MTGAALSQIGKRIRTPAGSDDDGITVDRGKPGRRRQPVNLLQWLEHKLVATVHEGMTGKARGKVDGYAVQLTQPVIKEYTTAGRRAALGKIAGKRQDSPTKTRGDLNEVRGDPAFSGLNGSRQTSHAAAEDSKHTGRKKGRGDDVIHKRRI